MIKSKLIIFFKKESNLNSYELQIKNFHYNEKDMYHFSEKKYLVFWYRRINKRLYYQLFLSKFVLKLSK